MYRNYSFRAHLSALWMLSHSRDQSLRWQSLFHQNFDVMGVDSSSHILCPSLLVPLDFCRPADDVGVVFFLSKLYEDRHCWPFLLWKKLKWRLGTGIRSTHKPQRHVSPTDTHSLGVPAFVENCFSIHFFYHFPLAVAVCVFTQGSILKRCLYKGISA